MADRVEIPPALRGDAQQQLGQLSSYLFRLAEGLNVAFDGMGEPTSTPAPSGALTVVQYNELRNMIASLTKSVSTKVEDALNDAKESGEFDGNGISTIKFNDDNTITFNFTDGTSFTTPSIKGEAGDDYVLTEEDKEEIASMIPSSGGANNVPAATERPDDLPANSLWFDTDEENEFDMPIHNTYATTSNTVAAVYGSTVTVCSLPLAGGHTYLVLGQIQTNVGADSIINVALSGGSYSGFSGAARSTMQAGGGTITWGIFSPSTDDTVYMTSYGYYSGGAYNFIGRLAAIRLL